MPELHARLLADVIALGSPYPLVLTGGYAVRAHRLVNRPSQDLDVATETPSDVPPTELKVPEKSLATPTRDLRITRPWTFVLRGAWPCC